MEEQPRTVQLWEAGPEVLTVGYGTYHLLDKLDPRSAVESLLAANEAGVDFIETSDNYGGVELAIGRALQSGDLRREDVVIATKTGHATSWYDHLDRSGGGLDVRPEAITEQIEDSLWAMRTRYVDLYQLHGHDPEVDPASQAEAMHDLVDEGKIKAWGVSNYTRQALEQLLEACDQRDLLRPDTLQNTSSVLGDFDSGAIDLAREVGMTVLARSPLLCGALTNESFDFMLADGLELQAALKEGTLSPKQEEYASSLIDAYDTVGKLRERASLAGLSLAQLSLAWVTSQPNTVALNSMTREEYITEAVDAARTTLSPSLVEIIIELRGHENAGKRVGQLQTAMAIPKRYYAKH